MRSSTVSRIRPTRRSCRSAAARAAATTTRSTACRSPTHQPRGRQPDDRVARRRQGAGAYLRRRDGPHRRRRLQHHLEVGQQQLARHGVLPDAAGARLRQQLLQPEGARAVRRQRQQLRDPEQEAGHRLVHPWRRLWRSDREEPDVLLVRHGGLPQHLHAQLPRHRHTRPRPSVVAISRRTTSGAARSRSTIR